MAKKDMVEAVIEYDRNSVISLAEAIIELIYERNEESYEAYCKELKLVLDVVGAVYNANVDYPKDVNNYPF